MQQSRRLWAERTVFRRWRERAEWWLIADARALWWQKFRQMWCLMPAGRIQSQYSGRSSQRVVGLVVVVVRRIIVREDSRQVTSALHHYERGAALRD